MDNQHKEKRSSLKISTPLNESELKAIQLKGKRNSVSFQIGNSLNLQSIKPTFDERKLSDINLPYFYVNLFIKNEIHSGKRLQCFEDITSDSCSTSTLSNENSFTYEHKYTSEEEESYEDFNCTSSVLNFIM